MEVKIVMGHHSGHRILFHLMEVILNQGQDLVVILIQDQDLAVADMAFLLIPALDLTSDLMVDIQDLMVDIQDLMVDIQDLMVDIQVLGPGITTAMECFINYKTF